MNTKQHTHESYGQISFSRVNSIGTKFYGSELPQDNYISLEIRHSELDAAVAAGAAWDAARDAAWAAADAVAGDAAGAAARAARAAELDNQRQIILNHLS